MMRNVLVLNQDFSPFTVCTVQRAFLLVFLQKAELLSGAANQSLRTISEVYPMPAVIRLHHYIRIPYRGVVLTRQNIFKRDHFECQYCGAGKELTIDHVMPRSRGGKSTWKNLITACKHCNAKKGHHTPQEAGMALAKQPYKPSYIIFLRDFSGLSREEWRPYLR
ncbi:MAG: HNH endonuclease [Bacteroidota bacterium]|nr:HNH endonuclease [Bacteroidota bacterium]